VCKQSHKSPTGVEASHSRLTRNLLFLSYLPHSSAGRRALSFPLNSCRLRPTDFEWILHPQDQTMFSAFLSRLRLNSTEQNSDDIDDTSSLGRSLNLPWPVTESSARRPTAVKKEWMYGQSGSHASGTSGITISPPTLRAGPNSLTGFDDYTAMSASGISHGRQVPTSPPRIAALPEGQYNSMEKTRKFESRPLGQTPMVYGPPAVVRLDSGADESIGDNTTMDMDVRYISAQETDTFLTQLLNCLGPSSELCTRAR